jgi:DNA-binding HxlR family transcriptional regulator
VGCIMQLLWSTVGAEMLGRTYDDQVCSLARALEVVGERWTLLVLREVFMGRRRFDEIAGDLGIARNVLQARLERLIEVGVLERRVYAERPLRHEYRLTDAGVDLWYPVIALMQWGDAHAPAAGGKPTVVLHRGCGGELDRHLTCTRCGAAVGPREATAVAGPGAAPDHPLLRAASA